MLDSDARTGNGFWHWAFFNPLASTTSLPTGAADDGLPEGAQQLANDAGFRGAAPPSGHGVHQYDVVIHTLDVEKLDIPVESNGNAGQDVYLAEKYQLVRRARLAGRAVCGARLLDQHAWWNADTLRGQGLFKPISVWSCYGGCGRISDMPVLTSSFAHIRLTVTNIGRSRAFYEDIFGWPVAYEVPEGADESTREQLSFLFGGVIYRVGDSLLGLRPVASDTFDEDRVGLDHVSFSVAGWEDLSAAAKLLDERGVPHSGIKDIGSAHILEFRDPDNIALELFAAKA